MRFNIFPYQNKKSVGWKYSSFSIILYSIDYHKFTQVRLLYQTFSRRKTAWFDAN